MEHPAVLVEEFVCHCRQLVGGSFVGSVGELTSKLYWETLHDLLFDEVVDREFSDAIHYVRIMR